MRALAQGSQCAVCLKHFEANKFLCNHLEYSTTCRHALINARIDHQPEPGVGSRRFDDGSRQLLPATQALGPGQCWDFTPAVDEPDMPCECILRDMESCFCHDSGRFAACQDLLSHVRDVFRSQCLQRSRLRATAVSWSDRFNDTLQEDEDWPLQWIAWHSHVARFLLGVDFVDWLGVDCQGVEATVSTFGQAEVLLPWLEFPRNMIATVPVVRQFGMCVLPTHGDKPPGARARVLTHQQCQEHPQCLRFMQWADGLAPEHMIYLSCQGLSLPAESTLSFRSYKCLARPLTELRLFSDLLRGAFFLWTRRLPTCLYLPTISCVSVETIRKLAPFAEAREDGVLLANFDCVGLSLVSP